MRFAARLLAMSAVIVGVLLVLHSLGLLAWQYMGLIETRTWTALPARLWFVDQSTLTDPALVRVLPFIPQFHVPAPSSSAIAWVLDHVHIGLIPGVLGALLATAGRMIIPQQTEAMRFARERKEDRMRRARLYRREQPYEDTRKEPVLRTEPVLHEPRTAGKRAAHSAR